MTRLTPQSFLELSIARTEAQAQGLGPNAQILRRHCGECGEWAEIVSQEHTDDKGRKWERLTCRECGAEKEYEIL